MHWAFLHAGWLFIPLVGVFVYYFMKGRRHKSSMRFSSLEGITFYKTIRVRLIELPAVLQFMALAILILALARPQIWKTKESRSAEGIDIMIVLDTSDSMLIEDMRPGTRINAAKKVIKNFINGLVYDRVGLIVFSGESYTKVPLTLDYDVLLQSLKKTQVSFYDPHIKKGTAIGVALANSVARLRSSKAKSKVVIFLTDGEDNAGSITPQTALEILKQYNLRVYTIGVGGRSGTARVPIKIKDITGRQRIIYQRIKTKINEVLLKKIAAETKGKYFRAYNTKTLKVIFSEISKLEKSTVKIAEGKQYTDLFPRFLEAAFLLYIISLLLSLFVFWRGI